MCYVQTLFEDRGSKLIEIAEARNLFRTYNDAGAIHSIHQHLTSEGCTSGMYGDDLIAQYSWLSYDGSINMNTLYRINVTHTDPLDIPWKYLAPDIKFAAQSSKGTVSLYQEAPVKSLLTGGRDQPNYIDWYGEGILVSGVGSCILAIKPVNNWELSLTARPERLPTGF